MLKLTYATSIQNTGLKLNDHQFRTLVNSSLRLTYVSNQLLLQNVPTTPPQATMLIFHCDSRVE
jgi:hypothetical protein